jgi:5-formyltetrahydrofolate cyclo-ligase
MAPAAREQAASAAIEALAALPELVAPTGGGRVGLSRAVRDELDLAPLVDELRHRGWSTWLPVVDPAPVDGVPTMRFREWRVDDELAIGPFGIDEPPDDGRVERAATELDVVVVPCVAVDLDGTRVGFGAGFYDRALAPSDGRPLVVVAAFDAQVEPAPLPRRSWDVPADVVVTDRRTIRPDRG